MQKATRGASVPVLFFPVPVLILGEKFFLRILLKQNTALLSYVRVCVSHRRDISGFLNNLIV